MAQRTDLTPIPAHIKITKCPPGRAHGASLPGEYAGGHDRFEALRQVDPTWGALYSRGCSDRGLYIGRRRETPAKGTPPNGGR